MCLLSVTLTYLTILSYTENTLYVLNLCLYTGVLLRDRRKTQLLKSVSLEHKVRSSRGALELWEKEEPGGQFGMPFRSFLECGLLICSLDFNDCI